MTEKRFIPIFDGTDKRVVGAKDNGKIISFMDMFDLLNALHDENEQLKKVLERCKDWINSDKNDYELTLAFIKNKGYSLKDVFEYEKELQE